MGDLMLRPIPIKRALPFIEDEHRRLPDRQGAMWGVAVHDESGEVVGVAVVGRPARLLQDSTLEVLRVAVIEGHPNACSMLYGACSRAAQAMGIPNLVTYTHEDEHGTSLKASNWVYDCTTKGGEHSRKNRPRDAAKDPGPKHRWWAPWSVRAQAVLRKRAENKEASRG